MRIGPQALHWPSLIDDGEYMTKGDFTADPQWGGTWTSPDGVVHIRNAGTGETFCGEKVGAYTDTRAAMACGSCTSASLATFATHHSCVPGCRR